MSIRLSKSKFVAGCQCLKRLYFQVHQPELAAQPDDSADAIIEQGRNVGMLARQLFPGGVEVCARRLDQAIRETKELIGNPDVPAIFEGVFEGDGVVVKVDVLQRRREDHWRRDGAIYNDLLHQMQSKRPNRIKSVYQVVRVTMGCRVP